ncbi:hypothetical protein SAMN05216417_10690 [Nitrosospira multiformis]|uniref:Uncharacterized protein n=1 Tax=Nitrosospira multiformis TaxID=1231 RepID=A0A1I7GYC5_9PROT|nr:hypothetical protein SAMN05216417_10690 [Nitrosospira multiformis]
MLQEGDLLIVCIAYQQTYPQQLWTIGKAITTSRFFRNFRVKDMATKIDIQFYSDARDALLKAMAE